MFGPIAKHRSWIITLVLGVVGLALIALSGTFHFEWNKIEIDRLIAEVGALLLVVGILHWLFELGLRREMLREVSDAIIGNTRLHDNGLESCVTDSRLVDDRSHWAQARNLTIGVQYSPKFFKDFYEMLRERCVAGRNTTVAILQSGGIAARYLKDSGTGSAILQDCIDEIRKLLSEVDKGEQKYTRLFFHDRLLRYSFICTDEFIWVKFFTNSPGRATVPAFKVRAGSPLFMFFDGDIKNLLECSHEPD